MSEGINWDYEEGTGYYHIYAVSGQLEGRMDAVGLYVPETPENDTDVQQIVDALRRIARRVEKQEPPR